MNKIYKAELLKLKHSKILNIVIFLPLLFVMLGFTNFLRYKKLFTQKGQNVWIQVYTQSSLFYGLFIIGLFITIVVAVLVRIENSEDNFKRMLTLPIKRSQLYISKFVVACGIVFFSLVLFMLLTILAGKVAAPSSQSMPIQLIYAPLLCIIACLPVISIQYYLCIKFKNIAIPLGVGLVFSLPSVLIDNTKYWMLFPWDYPGRVLISPINPHFNFPPCMYVISVILFIIFIFIGIRDFNKRDI